MVDKNGNLFKRLNVVDILAIAIVAILFFGIIYKFFSSPTSNVSNTQTFQYMVRIDDVRDYTVKALEKKGDIYDLKTHEKAGTIIGVVASPLISAEVIDGGGVVEVEVPNKYRVDITIETEGRIGEMLYLNASGTEIYVGGNIDWYSKWVRVGSSQVKRITEIR